MNIDLLIKLVKLANNNPSEHEANSAARRACKLIAEGNYDFGQPKTAQQKVRVNTAEQGTNQGSWGGFDPFHDLDWMMKEIQRKRKEEEDSRRRAQQNTHEPGYNHYNYSGGQQAYRAPYSQWDIPNPKKPKIRRDCSKCGLNVETNSTKEPFVCSICLWNKFREENPHL